MVLLCKQKALYVKCCIIANGVTDSQGDTLYTEDIKKIFTSFNNQNHFEINHNDLPIPEVSLLENYISNADETIGTAVVPSGSWNAVIRVDNPEIKEKLLTGEFKGVSLNNRVADKCSVNLTGQVRYSDIADAECVIPLLISFVEAGANGYGLHVMDYDAYIQKSKTIVSKKGAKRMDFKEFIDGVKLLIKKAEDTEEETAKKEEEAPKEEEEAVVEKEECTTEESEDEPEVKKEDETEEESEEEDEEEAEVKKEDDEATTEEEADVVVDEEFEAKVTAIVKKVLAELKAEEETSDEEESEATTEEPVVDEDTPKITKSQKVIVEEPTTIENTNYYSMTGRDPITGCKIRNQSKIL